VSWSDIVRLLSITTPRSRTLSTILTDDDSTETLLMLTLSIWFLCPSQIARVLEELRRNRLELIHSPTSHTHRTKRSTASATSSMDVVTQTWQSSAYWCRRRPFLATTWFTLCVVSLKKLQLLGDGPQTPYRGSAWTPLRDFRPAGPSLLLSPPIILWDRRHCAGQLVPKS